MSVADARIAWACRRGMLELDIVLSRFLEQRYAGLADTERALFAEALTLSDQDLWQLISTSAPPPANLSSIIRQLREV